MKIKAKGSNFPIRCSRYNDVKFYFNAVNGNTDPGNVAWTQHYPSGYVNT